MKMILVPTDFSAAAENAMLYGAGLANNMNVPLRLLHIYQMPVSMVDMPVLIVSGEELKNNTDRSLAEARDVVLKSFPELTVDIEGRLGEVVDEVNEFAKENDPVAIVVGTKGMSGFEKFLFGNTALSLIRNSKHPVIAVPAKTVTTSPRNVVLATDLQNVHEVPGDKIAGLINMLGAQLHIVHIQNINQEGVKSEEELMNKLSSANPVFHTVIAKDVEEGLQTFVQENNIDLLLVLPHKHTLYERLFFNLHTEGLIENMPVPVMCMQIESSS